MIIVTRSLEILSTNGAADNLISEGDALTRRAGMLHASHKSDQSFLDQLAEQPVPNECSAMFRSISGKPIVLANIAPLRDGEAFGISAWRAKSMHERELPDLRALLGLTRSEASLVRPLLQGRTPQDIATDLNLSVETVRSHLKNAYAKAGVTNRNAFVSLLTSLLP